MATPPAVPYHRIYVWEFPVRLYHWVNAICIAVLIVTGFLIGRPLVISAANEAYQQYWFGTIRFLHFATAFVFFFNFLARLYWGFVGNRYARWHNFIPYKISQWKEILRVFCLDVLQICQRPRLSIGHNSLAGFTYFLTFITFLFQAITGFGLYAAMSDSWFPRLFAWIVPLMGGDFAVRQWHHALMWFYVIFSMIHIYLVFYHDYIEGRATTSSMVGGWKFERKDLIEKEDD